MTQLCATARQPVAVNLRLDCALVLPRQVAHEAEKAASALTRLSAHPFGTTAWQDYHRRFFETYGIGALVPVLDVVDRDVGLGFPAGYPGSEPEPRAGLSARDERLLALAQTVALDGSGEIVLDERLVSDLAHPDLDRAQVPPHVELCFQLRAVSPAALSSGEFTLAVVGASRGAGTMTGRFVDLLEPPDRTRMGNMFASLPGSDPGALPAQLSFPPLTAGAANVARAPNLVPRVISLGEHRGPSDTLIPVEDLAVACDGHRLYLASLTRKRRLEPTMLHALDMRAHTPPLARFLAEVSRAQSVVFTGFDWGAAAGLPFLPRVRYRRAILSPARWLLDSAELPGRDAPWPAWKQALSDWRTRRRLPRLVCLIEGDQRLDLDLEQAGPCMMLRAHLDSAGRAVLTEAPSAGAYGWFGGRTHEIVVPLVAARPAQWPALPQVTTDRVIGRDHGHAPGVSGWLSAHLYGHPDRQAEILAEHLPELLAAWDGPPGWWFVRYRDPLSHLRLRVALPDAAMFGPRAREVTVWVGRLRRLGLLREVKFASYYPETGRWGGGAAMIAAEKVFGADSRALLTQFAQSRRPHPQVLAAAHFVAIATGFAGSTEAGMRWLIDHGKAGTSTAPPRPVLDEAVRLADPSDDWAALRAGPGGQAIIGAFRPRRHALARYRVQLAGTEGVDPDAALVSLLHAHHLRAVGIDPDDERVCLRLARGAALEPWPGPLARRRRQEGEVRMPQADAAEVVVDAIADSLASPSAVHGLRLPQGWQPESLAFGAAGVALLHIERAHAGQGPWRRAHDWLACAGHGAVSSGEGGHLYYGAPALAFALHGAADRTGRYARALDTLDRHIAVATCRRLERAHARMDRGELASLAEFDAIRGLAGIGAYLLRRARHAPLLRAVLVYLVRLTEPVQVDGEVLPGWWTGLDPSGRPSPRFPGGHANNGMAHGIGGPLALLSQTAMRGPVVDGQAEAIGRICAWLDRWRQDGPAGPGWPYWVTRAQARAGLPPTAGPLRPSWCYGTAGLARAQQLAALAVGDTARQRTAEDALIAALTDPGQLAAVTDLSLCHGYAGLMQIARRAAADATGPRLDGCVPRLLAAIVPNGSDTRQLTASLLRPPAGDIGLLAGAAGVALALHAASADTAAESGWDACLLIS